MFRTRFAELKRVQQICTLYRGLFICIAVESSGLRVQGAGFSVQSRVEVSRCCVWGLGFRVSGAMIEVVKDVE